MFSHERMLGLAAAGMSSVLLLTACGGDGQNPTSDTEEAAEDPKEIELAVVAWEEALMVTAMWEVILEEKGYEVEVTEMDPAPVFQSLENGEADAYLDAWLPNTHGEYWDEYGDDLEDLGVWYDNAVLTLTVPGYMEDVDEIGDLPGHADELGNRIVGIDPGAGLTAQTENEAMPGYGLDEHFELVTSSDARMQEELESAVTRQEPIVVTLWRPHQAYAQHDLKDLEDPQGLMGEPETLHAVGRDGFTEEYPVLSGWLENWQMSDEELAELAVFALDGYEDAPKEGARVWLGANPQFLERTLGADAAGLMF
ncbi:glycine betaine ABC transporter substrate-binding protein [Nocardiopsis kunsanensis]|uniref:ABC-type glycine betaine transport system substrate-binding domain-containing protein n=1 Tax=Nocardiopsis kunsanensis TaxID=141693 RepID=A0A918XBP4_9ACTN|nr:glycine betaine ABC transporter substrate-binding protein [Nocardiopsis kunsanensis]GHD24453.1 hypothetical protein GCM10007147_20480 [Nocardiopsis kunsanensis]